MGCYVLLNVVVHDRVMPCCSTEVRDRSGLGTKAEFEPLAADESTYIYHAVFVARERMVIKSRLAASDLDEVFARLPMNGKANTCMQYCVLPKRCRELFSAKDTYRNDLMRDSTLFRRLG